ncbi:hypothetical protein [Variovorax sp. OV700]|jgi:NADPH:quinone reductase-like Zn-dependent oxidoreductase|nr:hypothetical protein [Variovorax sp. OV700]SDI64298.1 hypothetical protein SAMN05444748_106179 [Variovorax sp. OV700]
MKAVCIHGFDAVPLLEEVPWVALHEVARLQAGEQVLVTGASGAVGSLAM